MERHRDCDGLATWYHLSMGEDDEGPLPTEKIWICHRCGDFVDEALIYDSSDDEVLTGHETGGES